MAFRLKEIIMKRIIVGGMGRSGTTFLQTVLGAGGRLYIFPESHYFPNIYMGKKNLFFRMFFSFLYRRYVLVRNFSRLDIKIEKYKIFQNPESTFVKAIDFESKRRKMLGWVEKTPANVLCLDKIMRLSNTSSFEFKYIMMVRRFDDVVRSQKIARSGSEKAWGGAFNIDVIYQRWIKTIENIIEVRNREDVLVVVYEDLLESPVSVLRKISEFIKLEITVDDYKNSSRVARHVVTKGESWKLNNFKTTPIIKDDAEVLNAEEISRLKEMHWEKYYANFV